MIDAAAAADNARAAQELLAEGRLARVNVRGHTKGNVHVYPPKISLNRREA